MGITRHRSWLIMCTCPAETQLRIATGMRRRSRLQHTDRLWVRLREALSSCTGRDVNTQKSWNSVYWLRNWFQVTSKLRCKLELLPKRVSPCHVCCGLRRLCAGQSPSKLRCCSPAETAAPVPTMSRFCSFNGRISLPPEVSQVFHFITQIVEEEQDLHDGLCSDSACFVKDHGKRKILL